jgi:hypothetical protein
MSVNQILSYWWVILTIPLLIIGIVFGFFPEKVIRFRAKMQQNMFRSFNMNEKQIDRLFGIFSESYSQRINDEQQKPDEFRFMMIGVRIMGFFSLLILIIAWFIIIASIIQR